MSGHRVISAVRGAVCWVFATAALSGVARAQGEGLRLRLDSAAMLIGSPNRLLVIGVPPGATVDFSPLDTVTAFEPLGEAAEVVREDGERALALPFSVYDSVGLRLPGLPVIAGGETLRTNPVALLVDFPPSDSTVYSYRSIRREGARLGDYAAWIAAGVTALLLGLGAWYYWRSRRGEPTPVPARLRPPHELALEALAALEESPAPDKDYYSALDRTLRVYLDGRYGIPAPERTTREVTAMMLQRGLPVAGVAELLDEVDLVKFARAELPAERRRESLERVRVFVERTKPAPPAAPPAAQP